MKKMQIILYIILLISILINLFYYNLIGLLDLFNTNNNSNDFGFNPTRELIYFAKTTLNSFENLLYLVIYYGLVIEISRLDDRLNKLLNIYRYSTLIFVVFLFLYETLKWISLISLAYYNNSFELVSKVNFVNGIIYVSAGFMSFVYAIYYISKILVQLRFKNKKIF